VRERRCKRKQGTVRVPAFSDLDVAQHGRRRIRGMGLPVAMERKVTLTDLQLISFIGHAERTQHAPKDLFWNGEMGAAQHVGVIAERSRTTQPALVSPRRAFAFWGGRLYF
jgi:hypothetical protein